MSEKKYIFKIDNSKAIKKSKNNLSSDVKEEIISSDFKITCDNCLYDKEIKLVENYKDYYDCALILLGGVYFTVMRSNENGGDVIAYFSDKDGTRKFYSTNDERCIINVIPDFKDLYNAVSTNDIFLLENLGLVDIESSDIMGSLVMR